MTDLGRLLLARRDDRSLQEVTNAIKKAGQKSFSQQALSNYERGVLLPAENRLQDLATGYDVHLEELHSHYLSSTCQLVAGSISQEQFLNAVHSSRPGDHLVIIAQKPVIAEKSELVGPLKDLLDRRASFTYVACVQKKETPDANLAPWDNNHAYNARHLARALTAGTLEPKERVKYLLIGKPDPKDFTFLRAYGATCYLSRRHEAKHQKPGLWSQTKDEDGKHWWTPLDTGFQEELHDWLTSDCGLDLPGPSFDTDKVETASERQLRVLPLEEFALSS